MSKPVAKTPPLPTAATMTAYDKTLSKSLYMYLGDLARKINQSVASDGSDSMSGDLVLYNRTVAQLGTTTPHKGSILFVTNGRKVGEGSGAGTGVLAYYDGTAWRAVASDTTVLA